MISNNIRNVVSGSSQLRLTVSNQGGIIGDNFLGEIVVPLNGLKDQTINDTWFDLYDRNGAKLTGELNAKLQWIHSKAF